MRVVTSAQMKQIEENSLTFDLTYTRLMENAGSAAAACIRRLSRMEGRNCIIFCGSGNNGGDGFVVARKLYENGSNVVVVLSDGPPRSEEAKTMLDMLNLMEVPVFDMEADSDKIPGCLHQADIVIDALYGTGFRGKLKDSVKEAAGLICDAVAAVISLDVPSGVECDTGKASPGAVQADFTIVFDCLKPVHVIPAAQIHCGRVELVNIGIPKEAYADIESIFSEIGMEQVLEAFPPRAAESHKGTFGTLLAVCGSSRYRGAAVLAALGALRSGVGICQVASVEPVCAALLAHVCEPVCLPLPHNQSGGISASEALPLLAASLRGSSAVLFGCGCGDNEDTAILLEFLLKNSKSSIVVDADGINALSRNINILQEASVPVILTPHPGEMARLCGVDVGEIQANRMGIAMDFARKHGVTLVLKGHETLIGTPDGKILINRTGGPGLAKGGSGDILAGMIASLCAQGVPAHQAAAAAVHLHGMAGDRAAARLSEHAMLPSELLRDLCDILSQLGVRDG